MSQVPPSPRRSLLTSFREALGTSRHELGYEQKDKDYWKKNNSGKVKKVFGELSGSGSNIRSPRNVGSKQRIVGSNIRSHRNVASKQRVLEQVIPTAKENVVKSNNAKLSMPPPSSSSDKKNILYKKVSSDKRTHRSKSTHNRYALG